MIVTGTRRRKGIEVEMRCDGSVEIVTYRSFAVISFVFYTPLVPRLIPNVDDVVVVEYTMCDG